MNKILSSGLGLLAWLTTGCFLRCFADVKSTTNSINFDLNFDGNAEMLLSGNGLFIGAPVREPSENLQVMGNAIVTQQLSIGGNSGSSNLNIFGTMAMSSQFVSNNTTLSNNSLVFINSSSSNISITLPFAANVTGRIYTLKKTSTANDVWIYGDNCSIDDLGSIEWRSGNTLPSLEIISNGQQWMVTRSFETPKTVAADNLIGWWKLDETSGTIIKDASSGARNGTFSGTLSSANTSTGVILSAVSFNNSNTINLGSTLDIDDISFSLCAWAKRVGTDDDYIFGQGTTLSNNTSLHVGFKTTNKFIFGFCYNDLTTTAAYTDSDWNFWVVTHDIYTLTKQIFKNGVLQVATHSAGTGRLNSSNQSFFIGKGLGSSQFQGQLDDVRIYNKVLTPAEIMALYGDYK